VPKTMAATTAATAAVVPTRAPRTGTALRPCPGSNAIRTPKLPGTEPASPSAEASREERTGAGSASPSAPGARAAARSAVGTTISSGAAAMTANPAARMARLTSIPGLGSAARAAPTGMSGDAARDAEVPGVTPNGGSVRVGPSLYPMTWRDGWRPRSARKPPGEGYLRAGGQAGDQRGHRTYGRAC
jgi:hypothetical protein